MSATPPRVGLMPLTSSLLPNVGSALQRRAMREAPVSEGAPAHAPNVHEMFDGRVDDDDDGPMRVEEMAGAKALRAEMEATRRAGHAPVSEGDEADDAPRTYTLGQLVEMVQARRGRSRRIVEAGDPDGPEELPAPRSILGAVVKAMQAKG